MTNQTHPRFSPGKSEGLAGPASGSVGFGYVSSHRHVTEKYLSDAFDPECTTHFDLDLFKPNVSLFSLLNSAQNRGEAPEVYVHLLDNPALPHDLQNSPIQTAGMDIDSFSWTNSRIRWSMLFDYVFVWHLSMVPLYEAAGHPKVIPMPHAVDGDLCVNANPEEDRALDLGWVGAFKHSQYARRKRIIKPLAAKFAMNDVEQYYSKQETAAVYRQSKIVVNVSRDEFPSEANMRCYEAMGSGALLITQIPTELTDWSFREGEHFVAWRHEAEIPELVERYLADPKRRMEIARAGQELTLRRFTFQHCRSRMLEVFQGNQNEFFAPARKWSVEDVSLVYLEYYYRYQLFSAAFDEFSILRNASRRGYWKGLPMILKMTRNSLKRALL
jgi:Glycosyl transferases group 1